MTKNPGTGEPPAPVAPIGPLSAIGSVEEWLLQVDAAIAWLDRYLRDLSEGKEAPGTVEQIQALRDYLETIRQNVVSAAIPSRRDRSVLSMTWILVDGWNPSDPVGMLIKVIDDFYLKVL